MDQSELTKAKLMNIQKSQLHHFFLELLQSFNFLVILRSPFIFLHIVTSVSDWWRHKVHLGSAFNGGDLNGNSIANAFLHFRHEATF